MMADDPPDYDRNPDIMPSIWRVEVVYVEEIEAFDEDEASDKMAVMIDKNHVSEPMWTITKVD